MASTRPPRKGATRGLSAFVGAREGGVAVTVALSIAVLVGSAALALDLGRLYNAVTELDNAADAAALAAASQLDDDTGACARAIAAATDTNLENVETFASETGGPQVFIDGTAWPTNPNIRFLSRLVKDTNGIIVGDYIDTDDFVDPAEPDVVSTDIADCDTNATFVEVTVDRTLGGQLYTVVFDFAQVVGAVGQAHPRGYAVAGLERNNCAQAAMLMCEFRTGTNTMTFQQLLDDPEKYRGRGVWLKSTRNNVQLGDGNFGFLELDCPGGGGGADCLRDALGMADPNLCTGLKNLTTEPGATTGARSGFNTRFGMYQGGGIDPTDPIWQPAAVTTKGLVRTGNKCNFSSWDAPDVTYDGVGSLDPSRKDPTDPFLPPSNPLSVLPMDSGTAMGFNKDDCAYPGGNCMGLAGDGTDRLGEDCGTGNCWDIEAYLAVNHDKNRTGLDGDLDPDLLGGETFEEALRDRSDFMGVGTYDGQITRWMVYQWELGFSGVYDDTMYGQVDLENDDYHISDNIIDPDTDDAFSAIGPGNSQLLPKPLDATPPAMPDAPHTDEFGGPHEQCYAETMGNVFSPIKGGMIDMKLDRRVIEVVMVNCDEDAGGYEIKGKTTGIDGEGFVHMFVLDPWKATKVKGENVHEIYGEIIGPAGEGTRNQRIVDIVLLYE